MFRSMNIFSFDWCVLESMEKLKTTHIAETVGDNSYESGDIPPSPIPIIKSEENSTPKEGMQWMPFSNAGHNFLIQFLKCTRA